MYTLFGLIIDEHDVYAGYCNIGYIPNNEGTDLQKLSKLIQMCSASSNGSKLQWKQKFLYTFHCPRVLSYV